MAGIVRGQAAFLWTDSAPVTDRVLLLAEPIRETRPSARQNVYVADSLDFQSHQTFVVGTGVDEVICKVRFNPDPQGIMDLIKAGSNNQVLVYHANLKDPLQTHSYYLIGPLSPHALALDADTGVEFGYVEVELVLRETS